MAARPMRLSKMKVSLSTPRRCLATVRAQGAVPNASTMPPGAKATPVQLKTFQLPEKVTGSLADVAMGKEMIETWRRDGIFQIE